MRKTNILTFLSGLNLNAPVIYMVYDVEFSIFSNKNLRYL